jgi:hypothetical protein
MLVEVLADRYVAPLLDRAAAYRQREWVPDGRPWPRRLRRPRRHWAAIWARAARPAAGGIGHDRNAEDHE